MPNNEGWQSIHERGQQTLAVMGDHAPALTVGEITLASHTAGVNALPGRAQAVKDQEDVVDDRRVERDAVTATIKDLAVRMPRKLEGEIGASDPFHEDLETVRNTEIGDPKSAISRGQRTISLVKKFNARNAAMTPVRPPLTVGGTGAAALVAAVADLPAKTQAVEDEISTVRDRRRELRTDMDTVDTNNKRLYVALQGEFAEGSAGADALNQIDTGSPAGGGSAPPPPPPPPPPPALPTAPQNVTVQPGSSGSGAVEVGAEPPPAGQNVTSFNIYDADGILVAGTATLPVVVAGFTSGAAVTLTVRAVNAAGEGPASEPVTNTAG